MQQTDADVIQDFASTEAAGGLPDENGDMQGAPLPVPVNTWDNHQVHIQTHNDFRKSQAFEMLDDTTKQLFESHVQMHTQALQMTMPQNPEEESPPGSPPGMDTSSEPLGLTPPSMEGPPPNG